MPYNYEGKLIPFNDAWNGEDITNTKSILGSSSSSIFNDIKIINDEYIWTDRDGWQYRVVGVNDYGVVLAGTFLDFHMCVLFTSRTNKNKWVGLFD